MVSAAKYNRRAIGVRWTLSDLPLEWGGHDILLSCDSNNNLTIDEDELDEIDWSEFSEAVSDFQEQSELKVDGKLGPVTLAQLYRRFNGTTSPVADLFIVGDLTLKRASTPLAPPPGEPIVGENRIERAICSLWNKYGGAIATQSGTSGLPVESALAVFCVESKRAYDPKTGLLIIRFEPHVFKRKTGTEIRWSRGGQEAEWQNFTRAYNASPEASLLSCSYGLPQLMGFNWRVTDHHSPREMVLAFQESCVEQVKGFFDYVKSRKLADAIKARDWRKFARGYNGAGRVDIYSTNIAKAMRTIENLKADGHSFAE